MRTTICLNMIVKDEGAVIERCLGPIKHLIDSWCIVDTGSTDDTKEKIQAILGHIPGELHERPWRDFGSNRTEALELARPHADFLLFSDAAYVWEIDDGFALPDLSEDAYFARITMSGSSWRMPTLIRADKPWFYRSKSHSALNCREGFRSENIDGIRISHPSDGARRRSADPKRKYQADISNFHAELEENPLNSRATFYLAQSYRDIGDLESAIVWYRRRAEMVGWYEEVWFSLYQIGVLQARSGATDEVVAASYLSAYRSNPQRSEPLVALSALCRQSKAYAMAHVYACAARDLPYPKRDLLYVEDAAYTWMALDAYAISAYWVGRYAEARQANEALLANDGLPALQRPRIETNLAFCLAKTAKEAA